MPKTEKIIHNKKQHHDTPLINEILLKVNIFDLFTLINNLKSNISAKTAIASAVYVNI
jgi:hypothetical protein